MNLLDTTNQDDQIQIDQNKNYLDELVGEGKKFKTVEDLARGKAEADLYIEDFKRRQDELRQDYLRLKTEYDAGPSLKELIDQMKAAKESNSDNTQSANEDKSDTLDLTKVEEMIRNGIATTKQQEREENNYNTVQAKLIEVYGPNYAQTLKTQISQLGLTADFVNDLARKHPTVLFKTLGLDGQRQGETFQAPPQSTNRNDSFGSNAPKRTWTYYEKIRKTDSKRYFDPKTQDQMFKDAATLGESFNDGDFQKRFG